MAKLTVIVTVAVFLFVLAIAQAHIPLDHKENDIITEDVSTNEQESVPKTTATWPASILLPSQKPDSETKTVAKPETSESGKSESEANDFLPITVMNFRPINRHFRHHPSLTLRHRRPCHHHRLAAKPWGPSRFHHREIPYGNDMLVSKGDGEEEVREIPTKWLKFRHGDAHMHRFHFWRDDNVAKGEDLVRPHHHHHHHHLRHFHGSHVAEGAKEREGHGQEQQNGFVNKIRKFLTHF